jgi:hypothetical protein
MNNPFDWKNYIPTISMRDVEKARKVAYQVSYAVDQQRKNGIEPSKPYANSRGGAPQDYVADLPAKAVHKKTIQARARRAK